MGLKQVKFLLIGENAEEKNDVVKNTTQGIDYLMDKNKITVEKGHGTFITPNEVMVKQKNNEKRVVSSG